MKGNLMVVEQDRPDCRTTIKLPASSTVVRSASAIRVHYDQPSQRNVNFWIVPDARDVKLLVDAIDDPQAAKNKLLLLESPAPDIRREYLHYLFGVVMAKDKNGHLLAPDDLFDVLAAPNAADLFIGGLVNNEDAKLVLYRGNFDYLIVPFSWFTAGPGSPQPDFSDFEVIDWGNTIRLGQYEGASDAVLYEFDADYRRQAKKNLIRTDDTFGGALRRLRLQRGLKRSDFSPMSEKEIARIERGQVKRPQRETIRVLADRLGVRPKEIAAF